MFQSTHPRGVRRIIFVIVVSWTVFQSTHPRGVRHQASGDHDGQHSVSIHAPTRGATTRWLRRRCGIRRFNPRTHEGCDFPYLLLLFDALCFNPRTHEGCDMIMNFSWRTQSVSIHAPTRGATQFKPYRNTAKRFQSTHPRGVRRCPYPQEALQIYVSIHAPTRGATLQNNVSILQK